MTHSKYGEFLKKNYRHRDLDRAIALFAKVAPASDKLKKDFYPDTAYWYECWSHALDENGDSCQAAIVLERAIEIHRAHQQHVSDDVVRCLDFLGRSYLWTGRPFEAERALSEAMTLVEHLPVKQQGGRGFILVDLAQMHMWDKEYVIAERLLHEATKEMLEYWGYGDSHVAFVFLHFGFLYALQNRLDVAERTINKAIRYYRMNGSLKEFRFAALLSWKGVVAERLGRRDEARVLQTQALDILGKLYRPDHYYVEKVRGRLARVSDGAVQSKSTA